MGQHLIMQRGEAGGMRNHPKSLPPPPPPRHLEHGPWTAESARCGERLLTAAPRSWAGDRLCSQCLSGCLRGRKASEQLGRGAEFSPSEGSS